MSKDLSGAGPAELLGAGEAAFGRGDLVLAESLLRRVIAATAADSATLAEAHNDLGVIDCSRGRVEGAHQQFVTALAHDPDNADALYNLAEMWLGEGERSQAEVWQTRLAEIAAKAASGLRVLIVCDWFFPSVGGTEVLAESTGVALRGLGMDVDVAVRALPERRVKAHRGMVIHEISGDPVASLRNVVEGGNYDAMLAFSNPTVWPLVASLLLPHPRPRLVVVPCVNAQDHEQLSSSPGLLSQYTELIRGADVVGVSSRRGYDRKLADHLGLDAEYLPNAVAFHQAEPGFRERHGLDRARPLLLHVANLWPVKNHVGLLNALRDQPGDWQLALVGTAADDFPEVAEQVQALARLDPRVKCLGALPNTEVASAMAEADLLLLPSLAEATPLVLIEAMSHRLPWLATPNCGSAHDHAGGLILPVDRFGAAIDRLLADETSRLRLGEAGFQQWQACYTWDVIGSRYAALLAGVRVCSLQGPESADAATAEVREQVLGLERTGHGADRSESEAMVAQ